MNDKLVNVTIKHMVDESPDTSWLGEYSNSAETEFAIDRNHSLDCPINAGLDEDTVLWYTSGSGRIELQMTMGQAESVSHSGQCDADVKDLSEVPEIKSQLDKIDAATLAGELKEYGAWDADELADHEQNLQRLLWLAGGDITDNAGCQCGENGDKQRGQYRYFNPGTVEKFDPSATWIPASETDKKAYWNKAMRSNAKQDYERMQAYGRGDFAFLGIMATAEIAVPTTPGNATVQHITSGGLWGVESDSGDAYLTEVEQEQVSELKEQLTALGFSKRAIATAFKTVKRSEV